MVWRTDGQMYSVCSGGGREGVLPRERYLMGIISVQVLWISHPLGIHRKRLWQSGQEAILRCGETTPAVGFAITNCELGHSNSSFLPSSTRAPVRLAGKMVRKS